MIEAISFRLNNLNKKIDMLNFIQIYLFLTPQNIFNKVVIFKNVHQRPRTFDTSHLVA